jgi:MFS family permease
MAQVFRHREPTLLITGQTISNFGDGVSTVALTLLVLHLTNSALALSLFGVARTVPLVAFLLVGGAIVDRHSRRLLLLLSDTVRALVTGGIVVLALVHQLHYGDLLLAAFIFGAFDAIFMPAISALTPEIVPDDLLGAMNALRPLSGNFVGGMIGPAVGGLIAAWSTTFALGIDASTFVASAIALSLMRATPKPARTEETSMIHEISEGLRFVRKHTWIWATLADAAIVNALLFTPVFMLMPYFLVHSLHAPTFYVGLMFAASGLSGAIGTIIVGSRQPPRRRIRLMWTVWLFAGLSALIVVWATDVWQVFFVPIVMTPLLFYGNVIWESMLQLETPKELLGRVTSVDWFVSLGLSPLGLILAGILVKAIGFRVYVLGAVIACVAPSIVGILSKRVNAIDDDRLAEKSPVPVP